MDLEAVDSDSLALRMSSHLVARQQGLGYQSGGFVSVGRSEAHANLEAGRTQDAAQRID
jgi:hypothetical protein